MNEKILNNNSEHEIWKPVVGYEGLYEVSNLGNVKSLNYRRTGREHLLTPHQNPNGYIYVRLAKDGKSKVQTVHRLVALAFLPNPEQKTDVNHLNEDKSDNRLSNLDWATRSENILHGTGMARRVETNRQNGVYERAKSVAQKVHSKPVLCVETGVVYSSITQAANETGIELANISKVCNGLQGRYTAGGFHWKFVE